MELFENELENVLAGYPKQGVNEEIALDNEQLYSKQAIENLKKQKESLQNGELSIEELENVLAGYPKQGVNEEIALSNASLYRESSIDSLENDIQNSNGRSM